LTPREFIKMFMDKLVSGSDYIANHVIMKTFMEVLDEWLGSHEYVTWGFAIKVLDWIYTAIFVLVLVDMYMDNYQVPLGDIIRSMVLAAMDNKLTCIAMRPIVVYVSEVAPQLLEGIQYRCE
jgi:hypothetical protein